MVERAFRAHDLLEKLDTSERAEECKVECARPLASCRGFIWARKLGS